MNCDFINIEKATINGCNLAAKFENYVNSFTYDCEKATAEMLKSENVEYYKNLCLSWVEKLHEQYANGNYDGRNEYSCKLGNAIYNALSGYMGSRRKETSIKDFVNTMERNHKTLQQSFSSIVFLFLLKIYGNELGTMEEMQYFAKCPLI